MCRCLARSGSSLVARARQVPAWRSVGRPRTPSRSDGRQSSSRCQLTLEDRSSERVLDLPPALVIFTKDAEKQKAACEFIKFAIDPIGQTTMVKMSGYLSSNRIATEDQNLLGTFYKENPDYVTVVHQVPLMPGFYSFLGDNALKITDVI